MAKRKRRSRTLLGTLLRHVVTATTEITESESRWLSVERWAEIRAALKILAESNLSFLQLQQVAKSMPEIDKMIESAVISPHLKRHKLMEELDSLLVRIMGPHVAPAQTSCPQEAGTVAAFR